MAGPTRGTRVPAVARAAAILRHLARIGEPRSVAALARELSLPRTSVAGLADALTRARLLSRDAADRYWLGTHVLELASAAAVTGERELHLGVLIPNRDNAYYTAMLAAADAALAAGGGRLLLRDARDDAETQRRQWRELLDEGVDVVLVDAVDSGALEAELARSRDVAVPVVAIGSRLDGADAGVTSDNTQAGLLAGRRLCERLGGRGEVAIVDGLRKNANRDRVAGFREAVREFPGVRIAAHEHAESDSEASGRAAAERMLAGLGGVDGVFAVCDPIAFGVSSTLTGRGLTAPIVSVDGRAAAVAQLTGDGPIIATAAQDPARIVTAAIAIAGDLARGLPPAQGATLLPVRLIDRENAKGYRPWG